MTKQQIYATAHGAVEGAMRAVGFPTSMSTGRDIEHIAHRVADAIYTVMRLEDIQHTNAVTPQGATGADAGCKDESDYHGE